MLTSIELEEFEEEFLDENEIGGGKRPTNRFLPKWMHDVGAFLSDRPQIEIQYNTIQYNTIQFHS